MAGIEIVAVKGGSELKDFIDLPWRIYAEYPKWVPPLKNCPLPTLGTRGVRGLEPSDWDFGAE
jgi:hypothetical protein